MSNAIAWVPLESNPDVLNNYISNLGVSVEKWQFCDIYGLEPELLAMIPPSLAVILLFPITEKYEEYRRQEGARLKEKHYSAPNSLFFIPQTISNACGTMAVLHILLNYSDLLLERGNPLLDFKEKALGLNFSDRAKLLERNQFIAETHASSATQGQTTAPSADEDIDLHFVAFIPHENHLFELDGRKEFPIDHGPIQSDFLTSVAGVIQGFVARDSANTNFSLLALAQAQ